MPAFKDLTGQQFNNWTVIKRGSNDLQNKIMWICRCSCGSIGEIRGKTLVNNASKGCRKCMSRRTNSKSPLAWRHGLSKTPTYKIWAYMIARCHNPRDTGYQYYGARGIKVCKRWRDDFLNFLQDMGERPENLTIDRIDNYKDYQKDNCRWATWTEQGNNQRRHQDSQ